MSWLSPYILSIQTAFFLEWLVGMMIFLQVWYPLQLSSLAWVDWPLLEFKGQLGISPWICMVLLPKVPRPVYPGSTS